MPDSKTEITALHLDTPLIGIQEKYLTGQLCAHESLTELDIRRFIAATEMDEHIRVAQCDEPPTLDPTKRAQALLLDATHFLGLQHEACWFALVIKVNHDARKIDYHININTTLDANALKKIDDLVRQLISEELNASFTVSGFTSNETGKDTGTYAMLRELYHDPVCAQHGNQIAQTFSQTPADNFFALKQAVYKAQLTTMRVPDETLSKVCLSVRPHLDQGKIKDDALTRHITYLDALPAKKEQHFIVNKRVSELRLFETILHFPGEQCIVPLNAHDYFDYLVLTHQRLNEAKQPANYFDELVLGCFDSTSALMGLITYQEKQLPFPFKTLTIDLLGFNPTPTEVEHFLFTLKSLLVSLTTSELTEIRFINAPLLSDAQMSELVAFVLAHSDIHVDITLPKPFESHALQQQLDRILAPRILTRRMTAIKRQQAYLIDENSVKPPIRKRPKEFSASVDIEQQQEQEQQQQKQVAVESESELSQEPKGERDPSVFYTIEQFAQAFASGAFSQHANSHLLDSSKKHAHALWCNWIGAFHKYDAQQMGILISKTACEELLRYNDAFSSGIDLNKDRLPAGFTIKKSQDDLRIDFNTRLKCIAKRDPLTLQTREPSSFLPLSHEQVDVLLALEERSVLNAMWHQLNDTPYNKASNNLFRQYLPQLLLLAPQTLSELLPLAKRIDGSFDPDKLNFLLSSAFAIQRAKNPPKENDANLNIQLTQLFKTTGQINNARRFLFNARENPCEFEQHALYHLLAPKDREDVNALVTKYKFLNLNGLLQLYLQFGSFGLNKFSQYLKHDEQLFKDIFANQHHYDLCLHKDFQDALQAIEGFKLNPDERRWWSTLLKRHCAQQTTIHLPTLVNTFTGFKAELAKLIRGDIVIPANADFNSVTEMTVALSRAVSLLKHCDVINRKAQLVEIGKLDLSSTGMIKAISAKETKQWAFITAEMQVNQKTEAYLYPSITAYKAPEDWKKIAARSPYKGINLRRIRKEISHDYMMRRYPNGFLFWNYTEHDYTPEVRKAYGYSTYSYFSFNVKHPGETDDEYMDRIDELMGHQDSKFITQDDFIKLGFEEKYSILITAASENDFGYNIHFKDKLPADIDDTYVHSFIYTKPKLYYIHANHRPEEISVNPKRFEAKLEESINRSLSNSKVDYLKQQLSERERRNRAWQRWSFDPYISLQVIQTPAQRAALTGLDFYVFIESTGEIIHAKTGKPDEVISLSEIDPHNVLEHFDRKNITSWFAKDWEFKYEYLSNFNFRDPDRYSLEKTQKNYFRYAAYQNKQSGMSLDVYQHAHQRLEKAEFSPKLKCLMYQTLAGVLYDAHDYIDSTAEIKSYIDELITYEIPMYTFYNFLLGGILNAVGITLDEVRIKLLQTISQFYPLPPLPLFKKFMVLCSTSTQGIIHTGILNKALNGSKRSIYNGMRDYTDEDFEQDKTNNNSNTNLILRHMQTVEAIRALTDKMTSMNKALPFGQAPKFSQTVLERNEKAIDLLHTLISTFQLTMRCDIESMNIPLLVNVQLSYIRTSSFEDALFKKLMDFYINDKSEVLLRTLTILQHIDIKKSKQTSRLSAYNFEAILDAVKDATVDNVYEILRDFKFSTNGKYLHEFYPDQLIPKPNTDYTIPESVTIKLKELFSNNVQRKAMESFLRRFRDASHYELVVTLIGNICNKLPPNESSHFLDRLFAAHGLIEPQHSLDPDTSLFVKLLQEIHATKQHDLFIYFIEAERKLFQNATPNHIAAFFTTEQKKPPYVANLSERMLVFVKKIKPTIDAIRKPKISQVESVPRLMETLLKTPLAELQQEGCSLLNAYSTPTESNLDSMQIPYHATYLCVGNDYYYVNKKLNLCKKLTLTDPQKEQFDDAFIRTSKTKHGSREVETKALIEKHLLSKDELTTLANITQQPHESDFSTQLLAVYDAIDTLVGENSGVKKQFLELFDKTLENYSPKEHGQITPFLAQFIQQLKESFAKLTDKNLVVSLCLLFKENQGEFTPLHLKRLLEVIDTNATDDADVALFTQIAVALISNEKGYSASRFKTMCELAKTNPNFKELLRETFYKHAPYPTLQQMLNWHSEMQKQTTTPDTYTQKMKAVYATFDRAPVPREASNGFHLKKAKAQLELFKHDLETYDPKTIDAKSFHAATLRMRTRSTEELLNTLRKYNPEDPTFDTTLSNDMEILVAVAAELLYRSKGREGNSMEINTTQYLAILSMLKSQGHVTNQIATGEGKSRIMMITCACQFARGQTVDFVTSDIHLATRDFVEYQSYFNLIGAPSRLIFSESPLNIYQKRGINFSDPTNLILFRNRARSLQLGHNVVDEDPKRRALLLDEADKTFFDAANSRFNFSSTGDDLIRDMPWVYSLLMMYFSQPFIMVGQKKYKPLELYYDNIDLCRDTFLQFSYGNPLCTEQNKLRLQALSYEKIEEWQAMAHIAKQQIYKEHFEIRPDRLIQTDEGELKMSSEVLLIISNELTESSKLSFGAHQCLTAEQNNLRENPDRNQDEDLKRTVSQCDYPFHVLDEKQIIYSSTSKNLLDDYEEGSLNAVTGTAGAIMERVEARQLYSARLGKDSKEPMHFIDVPRERGLLRQDRAIHLTKDKVKQIDALIEEIKQAEAENQPILVITEDAKESEALYKALKKRLPMTSMLQHVHPKTSLKDRNKAIIDAGQPKQITISTGMLGRGTDIVLKGKAKDHGLLVMTTFLPRVRDMWQYAGRSGRYGDKGEYLAVLDKARLKKALGKSTLTDGFYTNTEDYIQRELAKMDRRAQLQRLIEHTVGDFRKRLTDNFFVGFQKQLKDARASDLLPIWSKFFAQSDQAWNTVQPKIQAALTASKQATPEAIEDLFKEYQYKTQGHWSKLRQDIANLKLQYEDTATGESTPAILLLAEKLPTLTLSPDIKSLMRYVEPTQQPLKKIKFYDHYDASHDGRAVKYTKWYIPLVASLKGWANLIPGVHYQNARRPFANFRAWWEGRGQLFADFRASNNKAVIALTCIIGLLAIAAATAMLLLGLWLAPIYCYAMMAGGSAFVLGVTSGSVGRLIDDLTDSTNETNEKIELASWKRMTALSTKKPVEKPNAALKKEAAKESGRPASTQSNSGQTKTSFLQSLTKSPTYRTPTTPLAINSTFAPCTQNKKNVTPRVSQQNNMRGT